MELIKYTKGEYDMKKQIFFGIVSILVCMIFVGCSSTGEGIMSKEVATASISISGEENKTFMEVEMIANGRSSGGCETWQKDEEISFTLKSSERAEIEIGILPVLENGDYGEVLSQTCEIDAQDKKISIKVPVDGEYGICFINKENTGVSFQVEIDRALVNPFV